MLGGPDRSDLSGERNRCQGRKPGPGAQGKEAEAGAGAADVARILQSCKAARQLYAEKLQEEEGRIQSHGKARGKILARLHTLPEATQACFGTSQSIESFACPTLQPGEVCGHSDGPLRCWASLIFLGTGLKRNMVRVHLTLLGFKR